MGCPVFTSSFFIPNYFEPHYYYRNGVVPTSYNSDYDSLSFVIPYRPEREALLPRFRRRNS